MQKTACNLFYCSHTFQLAQNNIAENGSQQRTTQYLNDSAAFARLNNNRVLLEKISKLA